MSDSTPPPSPDATPTQRALRHPLVTVVLPGALVAWFLYAVLFMRQILLGVLPAAFVVWAFLVFLAYRLVVAVERLAARDGEE